MGTVLCYTMRLWKHAGSRSLQSCSRQVVARAMASCSSGDDDQEWGSQKLRILAETLGNFKPAPGRFGNVLEVPPPASVAQDLKGVGRETVVPGSLDQFPWWQRASVLLCLFPDDREDLQVILTKRTSTLSSHSGEVALPGGKKDERDRDDVETALREAHEEIGLEPCLVRVVTQLEPFISKFMIRIVPVVGLLPRRQEFTPRINQAEVESMFEAPLEMFLKDRNHTAKIRLVFGVPTMIHSFTFDYHGTAYIIWGATAAILIRAAILVYGRDPDFTCSPESKL